MKIVDLETRESVPIAKAARESAKPLTMTVFALATLS